MRLVVDMQGAQSESRRRGIGRYTLSLVKELVRQRGPDEIILVLNGMLPDAILELRADFEPLIGSRNVLTWEAAGPVALNAPDSDTRRRIAEVTREAFLYSLKADFVLVTSLFEGVGDNSVTSIKNHLPVPTACILYDLIPFLNQKTYLPDPPIKAWYLEKLEQIRRADLLLGISRATVNEAIVHLNNADVVNISAASEPFFEPREVSDSHRGYLSERFLVRNRFVMYTSAPDERKNHLRLIQAYAALPAHVRADTQLLLVGPMLPEVVAKMASAGEEAGLLPHELVITGQVSDEDLLLLYNACELFIFPSWHEGFGLPALEAMQCGTAVLASNCSSMPEVVQRPDALFDPFDVTAITRALAKTLTDRAFREDLEKHGVQAARSFSWEKTAASALAALRAKVETLDGSAVQAPSSLLLEVASDSVIQFVNKLPPATDLDLVAVAEATAFTFSGDRSHRQILVDVSELVHRDARTGIQRVVRAVLSDWLSRSPKDIKIRPVYHDRNGQFRYADRFARAFYGLPNDSVTDRPVQAFRGDIFLGLDLNHHGVVASRAVLDRWRRAGVQVKFVLYDLLPVQRPSSFPKGAATIHAEWLAALAQSDHVIAISRTVADEFRDWLAENVEARTGELRLDYFHLGADIQQSHPTTGIPKKGRELLSRADRGLLFLMVGTIEPRKGHAQALAAFDKLWAGRDDSTLIIVGKPGWNVEKLIERMRTHRRKDRQLLWFESASDEFLERLYEASSCLIAASQGEGFGLPLIEAAQARLPVLARDIPVFREVGGTSVSYFRSDDTGLGLYEAILKWKEALAAGEVPCSSDIRFSDWAQSSEALLEVVLEKTNPYGTWCR